MCALHFEALIVEAAVHMALVNMVGIGWLLRLIVALCPAR